MCKSIPVVFYIHGTVFHNICEAGSHHAGGPRRTNNLIYPHVPNRFRLVPRRHLLILAGLYLAACAFYFFSSLAVTEPGYPLDDAWIHQVFARNMATGHGFSFNPDQPISGATAPLWTLFMALLWPILGPVSGGILAGFILEFMAIVAVYKLTLLLTEQSSLALYAAIASILTWIFIWGALSGMEIGLYSALSLWGLYFYFKAPRFSDRNNYLAYALFAMAFLARPECALFLVAAIIRDLIIWLKSEHKNIIPWVGRILPVAAILTPYFIFNYSVNGSLFTQTFTAKEQGRGLISGLATGDFKRIIKSISVFPYFYLQDFVQNLVVLNPLLIFAFVAGAVKFIAVRGDSKRPMLVILLLAYVPLMGAVAPVLTATYHRMRLIDNIVPLFFIVGITGLFWDTAPAKKWIKKTLLIVASILAVSGLILIAADDLIIRSLGPYLLQNIARTSNSTEYDVLTLFVRNTGWNNILLAAIIAAGAILSFDLIRRKLASRALTVILIVLVIGYSLAAFLSHAGIYANDVKNISDMDKKIGLYLGEIVGKDQTVAINDIGAITYFSNAHILDLKGLVSPEITPAMISQDSLAFEYMSRHDRVPYVAIFPAWFKYIPTRTDILKPIRSFIVERNTILAGDTTIVYRAEWPDTIPK